MMRAAAQTANTDWAILFEDDAQLLPAFDAIRDVLCYFENMNVVMLDTRTSIIYVNEGRIPGSMAGVAYATKSLEHVANMFSYDAPERIMAEKHMPADYVAIDTLMAWYCNKGFLTCGAAGLVKESNAGKARTRGYMDGR